MTGTIGIAAGALMIASVLAGMIIYRARTAGG
jgi:hypothetical protein